MTKTKKLTLQTIFACFGFTIGATLGVAQTKPVTNEAVLHGKQLVKTNCSSCHEVNLDGKSQNANAPPFWMIGELRDPGTISQMLIDKSQPKHTGMPTFKITQKQADDIAAWIAWVQPVAHGRRLVEDNCASCHAVTMDDESEHKQAPPFRNLSIFYPIEALEEAFIDQIEVGHPDMPTFKVSRVQLEDILAYIASLQEN